MSSFDSVPSDRLEISSEAGSALTDFDYRVAASVLKLTKALRLPKDTLSYLVDYLSLNQPVIPVSQLSGFTGFLARAAPTIDAVETTQSTTFTNLATVGPELTGLPSGEYLFIFGAAAYTSNTAFGAEMALKVNATEAQQADVAKSQSLSAVGVARAITATLAGNSNTVTARYKSNSAGAVDATFQRRWLIALKTSNL